CQWLPAMTATPPMSYPISVRTACDLSRQLCDCQQDCGDSARHERWVVVLGLGRSGFPASSPGSAGEVHVDPAGVARVGLEVVVEPAQVLLPQQRQHPLAELARALAVDDLDHGGPGARRFEQGATDRPVDVTVAAEDRVQVQREHGAPLT